MQIRMFLADGKPDGIKTLELSHSTILGTIVPRHLVSAFARRKEATRPGVYLLLGPDEEDPDQTRLYIGEGDPVLDRIKSHDAKKDFWTRAYVFTSKDDYLTKTQIKYLEHQIYQTAKSAARTILDNSTIPTLPSISEPDQVESNLFLGSLKLLVAATGVEVLEARAVSTPAPTASGKVFEFKLKTAAARMVVTADGYVVLKDSTAVPDMRDSASPFLARIRQELLDSGALVPDGSLLRFQQDTRFDSPSTAASIVAGGNTNGRRHWKRNGTSLKDVAEA
jgi:hypothetical protein